MQSICFKTLIASSCDPAWRRKKEEKDEGQNKGQRTEKGRKERDEGRKGVGELRVGRLEN